MRLLSRLSIGVIILCLSTSTFACAFGQLIDHQSGKLTMELTYDTFVISPGQRVRFDFALLDNSTNYSDPVPFTAIDVSFKNGEQMLTTQTIAKASTGETGLNLTMPVRDADINIHVSFKDGAKELAATDYVVNVGTGAAGADQQKSILYGALGIVVLILLFFVTRKAMRIF